MINSLSKLKLYPSKDWKKVINLLKNKSKDEIIYVIDNVLKESYKEIIPYPINACDFATDFAYMLFKDLGYNVKTQRIFNVKEAVPEHNFLSLDGELLDFTCKQFSKDFEIKAKQEHMWFYKEKNDNEFRNNVLENITFSWFVQKAREKQLVGMLNYVPFAYIIENMIYKK